MTRQWKIRIGMPTNPVWLSIAKRSGRPVYEALSCFTVIAMNPRWSDERVAECLDMQPDSVARIRKSLAGYVDPSRFIRPCQRELSVSSREWSALRAHVFKRDDYKCAYCGARGLRLECDHVIPASRGGSDDLDNLTTACRPCNRSKRDKLLSEWSR